MVNFNTIRTIINPHTNLPSQVNINKLDNMLLAKELQQPIKLAQAISQAAKDTFVRDPNQQERL